MGGAVQISAEKQLQLCYTPWIEAMGKEDSTSWKGKEKEMDGTEKEIPTFFKKMQNWTTTNTVLKIITIFVSNMQSYDTLSSLLSNCYCSHFIKCAIFNIISIISLQ